MAETARRGAESPRVHVSGCRPPDAEVAVGLEFYASATPGAGGPLKERSEDFRVTEISAYPMPDPEGPFTVLRLASRNWEQHELAQRIAQRLGLPPHAVDWAGTKDRRAVAERLLSYRGPVPTALNLPDVEVLEAYRARSGLVLGHHYGNSFEIRVPVAGVPLDGMVERFHSTLGSLQSFGGFPNLFGLLRFGEVRPVTHLVGRELVRGDVGAAVETYLAALPDGPGAPGADARSAYAQHHDPVRALGEFPPHFRFERQLLDHLARGQSPDRALRALSRELRLLFVHAYQALLFNRWVSQRVALGLSLTVPEEGDMLLRVARDGTIPGTNPIPVRADNLREAVELARRERARLAGPLVGFETPPGEGRPGEILDRLLAEERVERKGFEIPAAPDLASRGTVRPVLVPMPPVGLVPEGVPPPSTD
ncbi:MAG: tRNA pseudouridine(13) synthase TruD, partial [Thermoplasmata archaeon]|nr:tRNA pseudouridine(13) synthase TruD [Thermoplasmata archaeon]